MKIVILIAATILIWRLWRRWKLFSARQASAKSLAVMFIAANEAGMTILEFCVRIGALYRIDPRECARILTVTQKDGDEDGVKLARYLLLELWFVAKLLPGLGAPPVNLGPWLEKMRKWNEVSEATLRYWIHSCALEFGPDKRIDWKQVLPGEAPASYWAEFEQAKPVLF